MEKANTIKNIQLPFTYISVTLSAEHFSSFANVYAFCRSWLPTAPVSAVLALRAKPAHAQNSNSSVVLTVIVGVTAVQM